MFRLGESRLERELELDTLILRFVKEKFKIELINMYTQRKKLQITNITIEITIFLRLMEYDRKMEKIIVCYTK